MYSYRVDSALDFFFSPAKGSRENILGRQNLALNYYPFGAEIKERSWQASDYRFGFNGKEKDDEVKGSGNSIAFEARIYDSRLGRFLSVDPLFQKYAWQSTYVFAANNPIALIDVKGMGPGDGGKMKQKEDANCADCEDQKLEDGYGTVEKQQFTSEVEGTKEEFEKFKETFTSTPQEITDNLLATYVPVDMDESGDLSEGDHIDIDIFGPQNGTVRVAKIIKNENSFEVYFQALEGHPDAGNIRFTGKFENGKITFEAFNITRERTAAYTQAYPFGFLITPILARGFQKSQWRTVMENFGEYMGKTAKITESIEEFEWDEENNTIGNKID